MDVFISYSRKDYIDSNQNPIKGNVISVLEELFQSNGITYWIDRDGIYSGSEFAQVIARSIKKCDMLLFVSSENSNNSKWTSNELATAIEYNKLIIPFRIDESSYHEDIVLYLAKLDYISYFANKEKALKRLLVAISDYKGKLERERLKALQKEKEEEERLRQEEEKKRELYLKEQELKEKERLAAIALEKQRQIEELNYVHNQIYELEQSVSLLQNKKDELVKDKNNVIREINILTTRLDHLNTKRVIIEAQLTGKTNKNKNQEQQLQKQKQQKQPVRPQQQQISNSNASQKSVRDRLHSRKFYFMCAFLAIVAVSLSILILCSGPRTAADVPKPIVIKDIKDTTYTVNGVPFKMIAVKNGKFQMGSNGGDDDEKPVHQVTLSDYFIGETEVTQELWTAVMGNNPSFFTGDLQRPVENVSWKDCQTFIGRISEMTGTTFSLPTEAQWEYAARGGIKFNRCLYSGSNKIDEVAWYWDNSDGTTHPVKVKLPNELGIYDMSGNVQEWCSCDYGSYTSYEMTDPEIDFYREGKVMRGGSFYSAEACRVAHRSQGDLTDCHNDLGLRLAISLTSTEKE